MPFSVVVIKKYSIRGAFRNLSNICDGAYFRKQLTASSRRNTFTIDMSVFAVFTEHRCSQNLGNYHELFATAFPLLRNFDDSSFPNHARIASFTFLCPC